MRILILSVCISALAASITHAEEWERVWGDEFNYEGLPDTKKWDYEEGFERNEELQYYMKGRHENSRVENGHLIIEAHRESPKPNPRFGKGWAEWQRTRKYIEYTSASLVTKKKFEFTYGRVEVRAKMPQGQGVWPAIWTLGVSIKEVGWPRCGEIDIMEYVGKDPDRIHATTHFADPNSDPQAKGRAIHKAAGGGKITIKNPYNDFHVYAVEWDDKQIDFFVDNRHYAMLNLDEAGKGPDNPFRKPHYLLLNLALGGSWGGEMDDSILPQKYEIDYVRVFKPKNGRQKDSIDKK